VWSGVVHLLLFFEKKWTACKMDIVYGEGVISAVLNPESPNMKTYGMTNIVSQECWVEALG
jgi:hypothetical protein